MTESSLVGKQSLSTPSITRLARQAGVKSMTKDCADTIRNLVNTQVKAIIEQVLIVSAVKNNRPTKGKILVVDDVYTALSLMGYQVACSNELGTTTCER
jgi:histone H3/H4